MSAFTTFWCMRIFASLTFFSRLHFILLFQLHDLQETASIDPSQLTPYLRTTISQNLSMVIKHEEAVLKSHRIERARLQGKSVEEIQSSLGEIDRAVDRQKVSRSALRLSDTRADSLPLSHPFQIKELEAVVSQLQLNEATSSQSKLKNVEALLADKERIISAQQTQLATSSGAVQTLEAQVASKVQEIELQRSLQAAPPSLVDNALVEQLRASVASKDLEIGCQKQEIEALFQRAQGSEALLSTEKEKVRPQSLPSFLCPSRD